MNPEHEMLADKLKGHIYEMNPWQYLEIRQSIDPEMMYIISENVDSFKQKTGTHYNLHDLFLIIVVAVKNVLCEREKFTHTTLLSVQRTMSIMFKAYKSVGTFDNMTEMTNEYLIYAVYDMFCQIRYHKGRLND